jgi:hypothetical protein
VSPQRSHVSPREFTSLCHRIASGLIILSAPIERFTNSLGSSPGP